MALFLFLLGLAACQQPTEQPWGFEPPVVIDTTTFPVAENHECYRKGWPKYLPGYIGELVDTIHFDWRNYPESGDASNPIYRPLATDSVIHISVDTTQRVYGIGRGGKGVEAIESYPVFLLNCAAETVSVGISPWVSLIMEAQDSDGFWRPMEKPYKPCTDGAQSLFLPPNNIVVTAVPICRGGVPTMFRICFGGNCSTPFKGSVEPKVFEE